MHPIKHEDPKVRKTNRPLRLSLLLPPPRSGELKLAQGTPPERATKFPFGDGKCLSQDSRASINAWLPQPASTAARRGWPAAMMRPRA
eukprot:16236122-Heterocapsa_arctica.AAC.1